MSDTEQLTRFEMPEAVIETNLAACFEAVVAEHSQKLAAADAERRLTYAQLNAAANQLAHRLIAQGLNLGEPVVMLLEHNVNNAVAILGILKAGGAYTGLLPSDPGEWQRTVLDDLETRFLVVEPQTLAQGLALAGENLRVIDLGQLAGQPEHDPQRPIPPDTLASIYFTSGSTGKPKGALRDHRGYLYRIWLEQNLFARGPEDRAAILYTYRFHAFVPGFFINLFNAVSIHFYALAQHGLHHLADWLQAEQISLMQIPASALDTWLEMLHPAEQFPHLRYVRPTQRFLRTTLEKLWRHLPEQAVVIHRMAVTETGVVTHQILTRATQIESEIVPVGKPAPTVELSIQDQAGNCLPPGEVGEIVIRSRFLSQGYWKRPEETRARFVLDAQDVRYQFYFSGDLGRLLPDGQLELMGRKDFMLKIRGFRVEPGEVEHHLIQHPQVAQVVVTGVPVSEQDQALVAYLVSERQQPLDPAQLRAFLASKVPDYLIPTFFVQIAEIPFNAVGKIDWQRLPAVDLHSQLQTAITEPGTQTERILVEIWAEVLALEKIGIDQNFFELGGNSLLAARIITRFEKQTHLEISFSQIFNLPTIRELASYADGLERSVSQSAIPKIKRIPR